jgi:5'-nucleotidase
MNPGGIRSDLNFTGVITHAQAFGVQPFSNIVTTKTMTGAQIKTLLEQQFVNLPFGAPADSTTGPARTLVLAVSAGFTYTWDNAAAAGNKVSNMALNGVPIAMGTSYRVTMNSFLATGGDNFPAFTLGTAEQTGLDDLVALEQYLAAHEPYVAPVDVRITRLN